MRSEAFKLFKRVGDTRQGLAQMFGEHRLIGYIVRHLAQAVHIVRKLDQPRRCIGQCLKRVAHHRRAQHFIESTDVRQAGWTIATFENNRLTLRLAIGIAFQQTPRLFIRPGF